MGLQFNPDKIRKLFSEMDNALRQLKDLALLPYEAFSSDPHKIGSAKYHLIVAIEGAIDLCHHVISKNRYRTPDDYAETFQVMAEHGVFAPEFTATLKQMARFRNRLVHLYWEVDVEELHTILLSRLEDIEQFIEAFSKFITREE
jgi:uncharacterized protein YutE (UPF0331/DUF86 family)